MDWLHNLINSLSAKWEQEWAYYFTRNNFENCTWLYKWELVIFVGIFINQVKDVSKVHVPFWLNDHSIERLFSLRSDYNGVRNVVETSQKTEEKWNACYTTNQETTPITCTVSMPCAELANNFCVVTTAVYMYLHCHSLITSICCVLLYRLIFILYSCSGCRIIVNIMGKSWRNKGTNLRSSAW